MITKLFGLLACVVLVVASGTVQAAPVSFAHVANGVWSTGFNASNGLLSGNGAVDPHYPLAKLPAGCVGTLECSEDGSLGNAFGPSSYLVLGPNGTYPLQSGVWAMNDSNSQWIGPRDNQTNPVVGGTTFPNVAVFASNTDFYAYRTVFNLTQLGLNPATANIQLQWASDDNTTGPLSSHIRLCSISGPSDPFCASGTTVASSGNNGPGAPLTNVNITSGFTAGSMALDFIVYNQVLIAPGPGVLNPSGLRVQIVSATAENIIPEPTTLLMLALGLFGVGLVARRN